MPTASDGPPFTAGPALQIRWVDSDLSLLETHPLTPGLLLAGATRLVAAATAATTTTEAILPPSPVTSPTSVAGFSIVPTRPSTAAGSSTLPTDTPDEPTFDEPPIFPSPTSSSTQPNTSDPATTSPVSKGTTPFLSNNKAGIAVTVLLSVLITIILVMIAFTLIRRRRNGEQLNISFTDWLCSLSRTKRQPRSPPKPPKESNDSITDVELGPRGTPTHPAELDGGGAAAAGVGAWRLHVSRLLSTRSWKTASRASHLTSGAASEWTTSSSSSEWENVAAKGRDPDGLGVPRGRAPTVRTVSSGRGARVSRDTLGLPLVGVEGRLSGGTFGGARRVSVPSLGRADGGLDEG